MQQRSLVRDEWNGPREQRHFPFKSSNHPNGPGAPAFNFLAAAEHRQRQDEDIEMNSAYESPF